LIFYFANVSGSTGPAACPARAGSEVIEPLFER
jgi:hypothetical protein